MDFRGVIPAVTTPFTDDLELDLPSLTANVERLKARGIEAIVVCGTMGEASALSDDERAAVIRTALDAIGSVAVGISSTTTGATTAFARQAADLGAHGLMSLPPVTYDCTDDEAVAFFEAVGAATDLPLMVYNNPAAARVDMSAALIARICAAVPTAVAVKECSEDARRIAAVIAATQGDVDVLVGGDDWALEGLCAGATGWITGVADCAPAECVELYDACRAGELEHARAVYARLLPLARLDMTPKLVQFFKAAQDALGFTGGPVRAPRLELDAADREVLDRALAALRAPAVV
jgi:1-pyrroline-4-hydroxy-2-carboxylate deaminase